MRLQRSLSMPTGFSDETSTGSPCCTTCTVTNSFAQTGVHSCSPGCTPRSATRARFAQSRPPLPWRCCRCHSSRLVETHITRRLTLRHPLHPVRRSPTAHPLLPGPAAVPGARPDRIPPAVEATGATGTTRPTSHRRDPGSTRCGSTRLRTALTTSRPRTRTTTWPLCTRSRVGTRTRRRRTSARCGSRRRRMAWIISVQRARTTTWESCMRSSSATRTHYSAPLTANVYSLIPAHAPQSTASQTGYLMANTARTLTVKLTKDSGWTSAGRLDVLSQRVNTYSLDGASRRFIVHHG